jgi:hypothetical protein
MTARVLIVVLIALAAWPADACHRYAVWRYPYPQQCNVRVAQLAPAPEPPPKPIDLQADGVDIPLPSLEHMVFPPDATGDAGERLKGVGLLRQLRGTN